MHLLVRTFGSGPGDRPAAALLKIHLPYHESDHVLNIAYNLLAGGTCLEHLELRRNDEVYLDALGPGGFPTRPRRATSAAASMPGDIIRCRKSSTTRG